MEHELKNKWFHIVVPIRYMIIQLKRLEHSIQSIVQLVACMLIIFNR